MQMARDREILVFGAAMAVTLQQAYDFYRRNFRKVFRNLKEPPIQDGYTQPAAESDPGARVAHPIHSWRRSAR
jgi:hypothetical protein